MRKSGSRVRHAKGGVKPTYRMEGEKLFAGGGVRGLGDGGGVGTGAAGGVVAVAGACREFAVAVRRNHVDMDAAERAVSGGI